jgi:hypothetical protein
MSTACSALMTVHALLAKPRSESDEDVGAALVLDWIPLQRREEPAEIEAAALIPVATEV